MKKIIICNFLKKEYTFYMDINEGNYLFFKKILSKKKLKITPQRLHILALVKSFGHIDIDTLYNEILKDYPYISLATIYKNVATMVENGIIKEIKITQGKTKYELVINTHAHFICTNCSRIEDIPIDESCIIKNLDNYKIDNINIQIYGTCSNCENFSKK